MKSFLIMTDSTDIRWTSSAVAGAADVHTCSCAGEQPVPCLCGPWASCTVQPSVRVASPEGELVQCERTVLGFSKRPAPTCRIHFVYYLVS